MCYRPDPEDLEFLIQFEKKKIPASKLRYDCEVMILGDFNINTLLLVNSCRILRKYLDVLNLFHLKNLIKEPTRFPSFSCLDHILCDNTNKMCQSGTICIGMSDHILIYCSRKVVKKQINHHNVIKIRSLKNYSAEYLLNADWSGVYCSNVDQAWGIFKIVFSNILDSVAPVKEIRLKGRTEPWINNDILEDIRRRDNFFIVSKNPKTQPRILIIVDYVIRFREI